MNNKSFCGTGVAIVTPFDEKLQVDYLSLEKVVNYVNAFVDYIVVLGTTGENPVLTSEEKLKVVEAVVKYNNGKVPIVVGIGGYDTTSLISGYKKYCINGVDAVLSVTPYYNKPNQKGLYEHFRTISEISPLPVILYNVPGRTGVNMLAETTLSLSNDFKNIIAIKEASGNMEQIMSIIKNKPKDFLVISGDDAIALPLVAAGADGVISVTANILPQKVSAMIKFVRENKLPEARKIHYDIIDLTAMLFKEGSPAGVKAALSSKGLCRNAIRLPLVPVSDSLYKAIADRTEVLY
jgi:4-hydroxy-tetrahydrodipicolinate synthase